MRLDLIFNEAFVLAVRIDSEARQVKCGHLDLKLNLVSALLSQLGAFMKNEVSFLLQLSRVGVGVMDLILKFLEHAINFGLDVLNFLDERVAVRVSFKLDI